MTLERQAQITELLKTTYNFQHVEVSGVDENSYLNVDVSYDGAVFRSVKIYAEAPDIEIRYVVQDALIKGDWSDQYTLCPNRIVLSAILEQHGFSDSGFFFSRNILCWLDGDIVREILDVNEVQKYVVSVDDSEDVTLRLMTKDKIYILDYDNFKIENR